MRTQEEKTTEKGLHWHNRPKALKDNVEKAFQKVKQDYTSRWGCFNGRDNYRIAGIPEHILIEKHIIRGLANKQFEFIIMDIGAGNFQWAKRQAELINTNPIFIDVKQVTIISVRGEHTFTQHKQQGKCTIINYGSFKVENLIGSLTASNHLLLDKVDMIFSSWCLTHLVDPVGTFLQAYALLKTTTGELVCDGFPLQVSNDNIKDTDNIVQLLHHLQCQFIMLKDDRYGKHNGFIIKKSSQLAPIPLTYNTNNSTLKYQPSDAWFAKKACLKEHTVVDEFDLPFCIPRKYCYTSKESEQWLITQLIDHSQILKAKADKLFTFLFPPQTYQLFADIIAIDSNYALQTLHELLARHKEAALDMINVLEKTGSKIFQNACKSSFALNIELLKLMISLARVETLNAPIGNDATLLLFFSHYQTLNQLTLILVIKSGIDFAAINKNGQNAKAIWEKGHSLTVQPTNESKEIQTHFKKESKDVHTFFATTPHQAALFNRDRFGAAPMYYAIRHGNLAKVSYLHNQGVSLTAVCFNCPFQGTHTPLETAIAFPNMDILIYLWEQGVIKQRHFDTEDIDYDPIFEHLQTHLAKDNTLTP